MKRLDSCVAAALLASLSGTAAACTSSPSEKPPPASSSSPAAARAQPPIDAASSVRTPTSAADIFPPGPGRELVLNTCGSCHPVVCTARGQRTADAWANIQASHKDKLTAMTDSDVAAMFDYLRSNFNDSTPEPKIPAELLQQSCTPF